MQTIVKAADDAALLALMPHLIGMRPRNSVVLLGFTGNRTHGGLRFDLPASHAASPALVYKRVSKALVGMLGKLTGVDGVVIAVVTDSAFDQSAVPPHLDFVAELTRCIDRSRFALKGVLCQASDGWAPYFDPNVPVGGYPLADLDDADIASQLPPDLPDLFDPSAAPPRVPNASVDVRNRVVADLRVLRDELAEKEVKDASPSWFADFPGLIRFFEEALNLDDDEFIRRAGRYLLCLQLSMFCDLMMLQWASDVNTALRLWADVARSEHNKPSADSEICELLNGLGPRPDSERLQRAIEFVLRLVSCADDAMRLRPLTVLAWLCWALGRGSVASVYLAEAQVLAPQDARASELDSMLRAGALPPWLFESDDGDDLDWDDEDENWSIGDDDDDNPDDWQDDPRGLF
jgi:hypothetical protein